MRITTDTYTGFIQIQNILNSKHIIGLYHNHIQSYTYSEAPIGTTGLILILQNLDLFDRYESTYGYYRTYTYFTDTGVPVGTIELNQIHEYRRYYRTDTEVYSDIYSYSLFRVLSYNCWIA